MAFVLSMILALLFGWGARKLFRFAGNSAARKDKPVENGIPQSEYVHTTPVNVVCREVQQGAEMSGKTVTTKKYPKCNCDGCLKQEECEYGHIIYEEFTNERLTLFDKFMMLHAFDIFAPVEEGYGNIATNEEVHNKKMLLNLDKDTLMNTMNYLQEQKKKYLAVGKCGRAYFNFMKMGDEIKLVKEAIKEYDSHYEKLNRIDSIKPFILQKINLEEGILQKDLFAEYEDIGKEQVSKVVNQLISERVIKKEKCGNTYMISRM